jgi:hypothetical protein
MPTKTETISPEHIMQIGLGFWASKVLLSAVELEVFTEVAKRPGTFDDLEGRLRLHERSARDFLDALVALGFLQRSGGVYSNTPATDTFLDKGKPSYIGGILEMANHRLYRFWNGLTDALRSGELQNEAKSGGEPLFATLYADPARLKEFLKAMTGISHGANLAIGAKFPWSDRCGPHEAPAPAPRYTVNLDRYDCRSATSGSNRLARCAGRYVPMNATACAVIGVA